VKESDWSRQKLVSDPGITLARMQPHKPESLLRLLGLAITELYIGSQLTYVMLIRSWVEYAA